MMRARAILSVGAPFAIAATIALVGTANGSPDTRVDSSGAAIADLEATIADQARALQDLAARVSSAAALRIETGTRNFPAFTGTICRRANFSYSYASAPRVLVSVNHSPHNPPTTHDPVTVWIEDVDTDGFRVCLREVDADNHHDKHAQVDWVAID